MTVAWTDIRDIPSGEFSSLTQAQIESALASAARLCNEAYFDTIYDDAITALTAHLLIIRTQGNNAPGGPMSGITAGPVSVQFAVSQSQTLSSVSESYSATSWGLLYMELVRSRRYKTVKVFMG